ncbi:acid-sensing ion channel 1-like [Diadema antillarum]|uniref:acid-sensing ion channel 1-like n=1 Tax=Diadema antillarum TaxID=105358 RepID=UPI003A87B560
MPLKRCKVLDAKEAQPAPKEPPPTSTLTKYLEMTEKPATEKPPAYPAPPVVYRNRTSLFGILYRALPDAVGVAGMKYAFNPTEIKVRRVFWLFLVLGALCVMAYQLVERSIHFAANPQRITVSIKYDDQKHFPSVAICNYNAFRLRVIKPMSPTVWKQLRTTGSTLDKKANGFCTRQGSRVRRFKASLVEGTPFGDFLRAYAYEGENINWTEYRSTLEAINMTDAYMTMGHSVNSSIVSMRWGRKSLTSANLTTKITDWGLCFVFNDKTNQLPRLSVKAGGKRHGLEVVLDTKQSEYYFEPKLRGSAGFQVVLYDYGTEPNVEDTGFAIAPGEMALAAVDVSEVTNLPPPHGICGSKELKHYNYYKHVECMNECQDDHFIRRCGCKTLSMRGNARECTAWEFFTCINPAHRDIGGSLGLWLGGSILTVFEFLDLIGHSAYIYLRTRPEESADRS